MISKKLCTREIVNSYSTAFFAAVQLFFADLVER